MSFKDLKAENARLTASGQIMARALGTAVSLLVTAMHVRDWDEFCAFRDKVRPQVMQMQRILDQGK